jgi:hypothetical protein
MLNSSVTTSAAGSPQGHPRGHDTLFLAEMWERLRYLHIVFMALGVVSSLPLFTKLITPLTRDVKQSDSERPL